MTETDNDVSLLMTLLVTIEDRKKFIEEVKLPGNKIGRFKDDAFNKAAEKVAQEILDKFSSFKGMANQPLEKFLEIKGLGDVNPVRKFF